MPAEATWNWQREDWPNFRFDAGRLAPLEAEFLRESGVFIGTIRHVGESEAQQLAVEFISDEAFHTSEIEGEILNRESLQSSIRRHFGLTTDHRKVSPAEQGIADMMVDLYRHFEEPLSHERLFQWHRLLLSGRADLAEIGSYRRGPEPMQIVSGPLHRPKVHFEAPPAEAMPMEMERFLVWYNNSAPGGRTPLPALTRASLAHWYFVSIHPFEDGNGRLARALAEKAISQEMGRPSLMALSRTIAARRKEYYGQLEAGNMSNLITDWMVYFAQTMIEAQAQAQRGVELLVEKAKFFDRQRGQLNERQEKALRRMFREGPEGFKGGLSAAKYISLTGASRATATRDLRELVAMGAVRQTGERKSTRYTLVLAEGF